MLLTYKAICAYRRIMTNPASHARPSTNQTNIKSTGTSNDHSDKYNSDVSGQQDRVFFITDVDLWTHDGKAWTKLNQRTEPNLFIDHAEQVTNAMQAYQAEFNLTDKQVIEILNNVVKNICKT